MCEKKYKLDETDIVHCDGKKLYRIIALVDIRGSTEAGERGGYVESEENLSHHGKSWVSNNAKVYGNARISDNAHVTGDACICDNAHVSGNAYVSGRACICNNARVSGRAYVLGEAWIFNSAVVCGRACVSGKANVFGNAKVSGDAHVCGCVKIYENANIEKGEHYFSAQQLGERGRTITFFRQKDKSWCVSCGSFTGTIQQFCDCVREKYGDSLIAQEYMTIVDLIELRIKRVTEQETKQ